MRIIFATTGKQPIQQGPAGPTSSLASTRYRAIIPAQQLARLGHQVQLASIGAQGWPPEMMEAKPDALVISKSFNPANEELARRMKPRGVRIVVDFCDDYFDDPSFGAHFRNLAAIADAIVASTEGMAAAVERHTGRRAIVITDPVEGPRGLPRFAPGLPALRIAWFGHPNNVSGIQARVGELEALVRRMPVQLTIVTGVEEAIARFAEDLARKDPQRLAVSLVPWSIDATWQALARCDVVWIPAAETGSAAVKSPNRLLEALWAGRYTVADALPAYLPFADIVPIGRGLADAVAGALDDPPGVEAALRQAQRRIARDHSPYRCGILWAAALGDTAARALRLNLGCGDKILPGYVNVDVVEARAGMKPDVVCDLHDLAPFSDASADEILSVHVVEHFWRWEVRDVMREWARVLKPGGRMIIECPNLLSACRTFLENPEQFSREDQDGQRTMWVFYGDPKWKDPLMVHRWGYTPESLKALLAEAGLAQVRQEPAQFKLREPRDMRVVGVKP